MIKNSKQDWTVGNTVKVGFLQLIVKAAIETPRDWLPDAYILSNNSGTKLYKFVPHNGLTALNANEASDMLKSQIAIRQRRAETVEQHADICRLAILMDQLAA